MTSLREELLVYGYIREYHKANNIELLPNDLILLFLSWTKLMDSFDKNKVHEDVAFHPEIDTKFKRTSYASGSYAAVVGTFVVDKGVKQSWKLKIDAGAVLLGIMDDEIIKSKTNISDLTDTKHKGYGLASGSWYIFHDSDTKQDGSLETYMNQFKVKDIYKSFTMTITMELDMTQRQNKHGILKYIIHNEPKENIKEIRTDGLFTNIAYDNININKKYRLVLAVGTLSCNEWIELLYE